MGTDFLFSTPSFVSGAARTLDLCGQFDEYNESHTPLEADSRALLSDLTVVSEELQSDIDEVRSGEEKKKSAV